MFYPRYCENGHACICAHEAFCKFLRPETWHVFMQIYQLPRHYITFNDFFMQIKAHMVDTFTQFWKRSCRERYGPKCALMRGRTTTTKTMSAEDSEQ